MMLCLSSSSSPSTKLIPPVSITILTLSERKRRMASSHHLHHLSNSADEDYIDMEVSTSSSNFFSYSINSPPPPPPPPQHQTREFEFQMSSLSSSNSHDKDSTTSPADELFYKGNLLPLHLPPRLQMVQKLLQNNNSNTSLSNATTTTNTSNNTPLESCNISPSESCRVSSELNLDEYFFEWSSTEISSFIGDHHPKKYSWSKKLKLIKQSSLLTQKLKASRAYLKSLFSKSGCSDESCAKPACNSDLKNVTTTTTSIGQECLSNYMKVSTKKNPFGYIENERYNVSSVVLKSFNKKEIVEDGGGGGGLVNSHRRSFSGAIKRHSATKSSSTTSSLGSGSSSSSSSSSSLSFSFNLNGCYDLQLLKRSISANSEIENSIEGAIAHCKQSLQVLNNSNKKSLNEVGLCSLSASRICGDKERPEVCSI